MFNKYLVYIKVITYICTVNEAQQNYLVYKGNRSKLIKIVL